MITKNIKSKILYHFFMNPTQKLRVRHIEKQVKVPLPSAIRYSKELVKEKLLKKTEIAKINLYSADRTSRIFLFEKKLFNLKQISNTGLIEHLFQKYSNPTVIVFGSYSKGEDIESSDIDLYVETPVKKKPDLTKFERKLNRKIQLFVHKDIKDIKNNELMNNILNGIVLNGFIEVFK